LLAILPAGCDAAALPRFVVRGKVSYRGIPLTTGMIVFTPDAARGNPGPLACAEIQADGSYNLRTENAPGAAAGWYRVTVAAVENPSQPRWGHPPAPPRSLVPDKFRDPELSGLTCEVLPGRENLINFNLE